MSRLGIKWAKASHGMVKVNVDASFIADELNGSVGVIIRDEHGMFLAASGSLVIHISDAHTAETLAVKHGLMLAHELGFHSIQLESDSIEVIN